MVVVELGSTVFILFERFTLYITFNVLVNTLLMVNLNFGPYRKYDHAGQ